MNNFPEDVLFFIDWHLTNRCNFYCNYCHPQIRRVLNTNIHIEPPPELISSLIDKIELTCGILMSGGEPFLYPSFSKLCALLTRKHYIKINTNLSLTSKIYDFIKNVKQDHVVQIIAAIHIGERERLSKSINEYIQNVKMLTEHGFPVTPLYVLYPPLIDRACYDIEMLTNIGVPQVAAKVFKGGYQGKRYPEAYSSSEREKILRLSGSYPNNESYLKSNMSFLGYECQAGCNSIKINVDGSVQRCATIRKTIGNLYNGTFKPLTNSYPCSAKRILVLSECERNLHRI